MRLVPSVLRCLSDRSKDGVVDTTLTFIEQPICQQWMTAWNPGVSFEAPCRTPVGSISVETSDVRRLLLLSVAPNFVREERPADSTTLRRELIILCQVSDLIDEQSEDEN